MSRILPHPPNFTAINTIALGAVCSFHSLSFSFFTVFLSMFFSDFFLGFHSTLVSVYFSIACIVVMGRWLSYNTTWFRIPLFLVASSLLFFIITNFGAWLADDFYPMTLAGLGYCYLAALPFLPSQILGDLAYGFAVFGCLQPLICSKILRKCRS